MQSRLRTFMDDQEKASSLPTSLAARSALVIAELGSAWRPWVERWSTSGRGVVPVVQEEGESTTRFALRVRATIEELAGCGVFLDRAVIVGGGSRELDALSARALIIRSLSSTMATHGFGKLWLEPLGPERLSFAALVETVGELVLASGVQIALAKSENAGLRRGGLHEKRPLRTEKRRALRNVAERPIRALTRRAL